MASWFASAAGLSSGLSDALTGLADKVQLQVNSIDPDLLKKLTLQSDDLVAERNQIDDEERRKEAVRDNLSEILPWETRDSEMDLLVDECREVILGLSSKVETFTGPYVLEGGLSNGKEDNDKEENGNNDDVNMTANIANAEGSLEKLAKLQPLPELLANFDLDSHVGLIQRLLQVDTQLVDMQMRLSSGGERELIFWKNYFFHCAYTRCEAGLSIDEIWSNEPRASRPALATAATASNCVEDLSSSSGELIDRSDDEIVFDSTSVSAAGSEEGSGKEEIALEGGVNKGSIFNDAQLNSATMQQTPTPQSVAIPSSTESEQYEFVASGGFDGDDGLMDELEAEILAALDD